MDQNSSVDPAREDAFLTEVSTLARRHARRLFLLDNADDADDIAQDVVLHCLAALRNGTGMPAALGIDPYVRTIVLRRTWNAVRANARREARNTEYAAELTERTHAWMSPDVAFEVQTLSDLIERTIGELPQTCRRVYLMVREEDASYQTVANALGITRSAVCAHVVKAQRRLRAALTDWHEERPNAARAVSELPAPRADRDSQRRNDSAA